MTEILYMSPEVPGPVDYVDVGKLFDLFDHFAFEMPLVLSGPKGTGKSSAVAAWAHQHQYRLVTLDCSEDLTENHLYGSFILRGSETPFVLGPVTRAMRSANEAPTVLVLEELNALSPQSQKLLNPLTDWRRTVQLTRVQQTLRLEPTAKLAVIGTMNDSSYGGVYTLNEDLRSRLEFVSVSYPTREVEQTIIAALQLDVAPELVDFTLTLAQESRRGVIDHALSTREVVRLLRVMKRTNATYALRLLLGKYSGEHLDTLSARAESLFGVRLK